MNRRWRYAVAALVLIAAAGIRYLLPGLWLLWVPLGVASLVMLVTAWGDGTRW